MSEYDYEPGEDFADLDLDDLDDYDVDEYDPGPPGLPYLENTVGAGIQAGLEAGLAPLQALAEERAAADAYWQERDERIAYEQHVAEAQATEEARGVFDEMIQQAGDVFDARTSAGNGRIEEWSNSVLGTAIERAHLNGDPELAQSISSPQGARDAVAVAAKAAAIRATTDRALAIVGGRPGPTAATPPLGSSDELLLAAALAELEGKL